MLHVGQAQLMFPEATLGALDSALWPALRCLRIPFLSLGSSAAIDALVAWAGLTRLEALDLEGTWVSVDAVRRIASAAPALRRLAIGQTPAADGADAIRSGHPELRVDVGVMSANHWPV